MKIEDTPETIAINDEFAKRLEQEHRSKSMKQIIIQIHFHKVTEWAVFEGDNNEPSFGGWIEPTEEQENEDNVVVGQIVNMVGQRYNEIETHAEVVVDDEELYSECLMTLTTNLQS